MDHTPPLKVDQTPQKGHPIIKHFYWSQKRYQPLQFKYVRFPQREMHVWAAGNGVASSEKRNESPSFDQKKPLQEEITPQR